MPSRRLRVLFLCTGNSCRSQMTEGWARALKPDSVDPYSAGTQPTSLNRLAVRAMAESGIDISAQRSKHVDDLRDVPFDFVVTVCDSANESCPVFHGGARVLHVGFDDPPRLAQGARSDDEALPHYRRVRDEIRRFVETIPESLWTRESQPFKEIPMSTVTVFDPPMCCSSGVCGADPDIALSRFAADLQWLQNQGVNVQRYSLSQQPERFIEEAAILRAVNSGGTRSLPIVMVDDQIIAEGQYPNREQLVAKLGLITAAAAPGPKAGGCGCTPGKCC